MNGKAELWEILLAAATIGSISLIIHSPFVNPSLYSDISGYWWREDIPRGAIPYLDYPFELPHLSGAMIAAAKALSQSQQQYYLMIGTLIVLAGVASVLLLYRLSNVMKRDPSRILRYFIFAPSMIFYMVYQVDLPMVFFTVLAFYLFVKNKLVLSGLSLGAAFLVKLIPVLLIPVFMAEIPGRSSKMKYFAAAVSLPILVNGVFAIVDADKWWFTYGYFENHYLENSWLVYLFRNPESWDTARYVSLILLVVGLLRVYLWKTSNIEDKLFAVFAVFLLTNYVYTPQMNTWLLPFFSLSSSGTLLFYPFELANAGIILFWFTTDKPLEAFTTPQNLAFLRALLLLAILMGRAGLPGRLARTKPFWSKLS